MVEEELQLIGPGFIRLYTRTYPYLYDTHIFDIYQSKKGTEWQKVSPSRWQQGKQVHSVWVHGSDKSRCFDKFMQAKTSLVYAPNKLWV